MPYHHAITKAGLLAAAAIALAAAPPPPTPPKPTAAPSKPAYRSVCIEGVPHVSQRPDFCGEACAAMYCLKLGLGHSQDDVFNLSGLDPVHGRGCYAKELDRALEKIGFRTGAVWHRIAADRAAAELETHWAALHADLLAGVPSIVCTRFDDRPKTTEHFRLVLGYDARSDEVLFHEPAMKRGNYQRMRRAALLALWPLKYADDRWTLIRFRLEPGKTMARAAPARGPFEPPPGATPAAFTPADFAQHMMTLKPKVPDDDFTVVIQPPFVVIGDESAAKIKRRAEGTVKWAVEKLKDAYFNRDPAEILDIWLFADDDSYRRNCKRIFGSTPDTPYGYFSYRDKALIMNISTGGGTLVHEIVHPYIAVNFPECPAWFNEGLASLYEQAGEEDGRIWGYTNWRLSGLQDAIRGKKTVPFKKLCTTTTDEFYNKDKGANYSQARYLCYYLQEKGLLRKFYREFHANRNEDPSGYATLQKILDCDDMDAFRTKWEAWVLKLKYR